MEENKPVIQEIGGYSNTPKSDPMGQTRISPIRAYGESEIRMVLYIWLILDAKLKRLRRHGSHTVKVAIKRAYRAQAKLVPIPGGPTIRLESPVLGGPKPNGLQRKLLLEEIAKLRGQKYWVDLDKGDKGWKHHASPVGRGHPFTMVPNFDKLFDRSADPEKYKLENIPGLVDKKEDHE